MSGLHYDTEFGESLSENLALAFREDVAESILGEEEPLAVLQQLLGSEARQTASDRSNLMPTLESV